MHIVGASVSGKGKEADTEKERFTESSDQFLLTLPICSRGPLQAFSTAGGVGCNA